MISPGSLCAISSPSASWCASIVVLAAERDAFCDYQRGLCCAVANDGTVIMYRDELRPFMPDITWLVCT